jgi:hypothetical protein
MRSTEREPGRTPIGFVTRFIEVAKRSKATMPRGSAPGERRGGRQKGTPNKATLEEAARQYAPAALERLAHLSRHAESEAAQVAACREILDRAYGKPTQPVSGDADAPQLLPVINVTIAGPENRHGAGFESCLPRESGTVAPHTENSDVGHC